MRFETVVFDLDGTLLNTLDDLRDSVNFAMRDAGYPERSPAEIRRFVGNGVRNLVEQSVPEGTDSEKIDACLAVFRKHYAGNMSNKTGPYEGVMELLQALQERGVKMGVVSNKYDGAVKELIAKEFGRFIHVAIGERPGIARKPAPDSVLEAMRVLGASPRSTVYVGDSEGDVTTARNAGVAAAACTWGFRDRDVLAALNPDFIIDSPEELLRLI